MSTDYDLNQERKLKGLASDLTDQANSLIDCFEQHGVCGEKKTLARMFTEVCDNYEASIRITQSQMAQALERVHAHRTKLEQENAALREKNERLAGEVNEARNILCWVDNWWKLETGRIDQRGVPCFTPRCIRAVREFLDKTGPRVEGSFEHAGDCEARGWRDRPCTCGRKL